MCGAALTWTDLIRQPQLAKGSPHIRRATPHLGYTYPAQFATAVGRLPEDSPRISKALLPTIPRTNGIATNVVIVNAAPPRPPVFLPAAMPPQASYAQVQSIAQPIAPPVTKPKEYTLRLDEPQWFFAGGRRIRIQLHDYGSLSIGVQLDYGRNIRLQKQTNPDPHEMGELTLIHQEGSVRVYHWNAARAPIGCYLLRVVGDAT